MHQLDKIDKEILKALQKNSKISNLELSEKINLSPTPCARRVKLLEKEGFIDRSITLLNQEKLGLSFTVFIGISLDRHTSEQFETFEKQLITFPEVINCSVVTGRVEDYLLEVVVRDMQHYESFLLGQLNKIKGVSSVHSSFQLRRVIKNAPLPMD